MEYNFQGKNIEISSYPPELESKYKELFNLDTLEFITEFISYFQSRGDELIKQRKYRKIQFSIDKSLPDFKNNKKPNEEINWKISPLPTKLQNRHIDLGDIAPSDTEHFKNSLKCNVEGVQVDFDDGECPSWPNIIRGHHNVISYVRGKFYSDELEKVENGPILMLRPRAWNMIEHNVFVNGREVPGSLFDYGLLIYHIGKSLYELGVGPYFYLSKVEGSLEALLWNDIFNWTQLKLGIPRGTIKACVLIENIISVFEMDEILYELREHSLGLNCGIWDYAASMLIKFGDRKEFILPDRNMYINIQNPFLLSYIRLLVKTCHRRGAPATGGMSALTTVNCKNDNEIKSVGEALIKGKVREIEEGLDGFLIYDPLLLPFVSELWSKYGLNQINTILHSDLCITSKDLLNIPNGNITLDGIQRNIKVVIKFIYSWLGNGKGHFILDGGVEDSATAEISRSQIWQYIYHQIKLSDNNKETITKHLIKKQTENIVGIYKTSGHDNGILDISSQLFLEIVTSYEFPEFITTYLYNHSIFRKLHHS